MKLILAATDFSARSDRAIRRAGLLAREQGARLMLLHVVDDDRPERLVVEEMATAQELLEKTAASVLSDARCEAKVVLGDPFEGIAKTARESAAELIVMGAHRKQILRDIFIGTSIERVMRLRIAPVLMVNAEPSHRLRAWPGCNRSVRALGACASGCARIGNSSPHAGSGCSRIRCLRQEASCPMPASRPRKSHPTLNRWR